jgi:hypothetical protein
VIEKGALATVVGLFIDVGKSYWPQPAAAVAMAGKGLK